MDPDTQAILLYVEGLKDLNRFRAAVQARAIGKPVVAVKAGQTDAGAAMANSHTGSLGSYQAFQALCGTLGIVVTDQADTAVFCADALARWVSEGWGRCCQVRAEPQHWLLMNY